MGFGLNCLDLDFPLASCFVPVASGNLTVKMYIATQVKAVRNFADVFGNLG